ncbi:MAG: hypothetical protein J0L97_08085 [Alphaproteobacteria bacterium]|nr:hypothetical protein [Alphaproteobacteria bacterium]
MGSFYEGLLEQPLTIPLSSGEITMPFGEFLNSASKAVTTYAFRLPRFCDNLQAFARNEATTMRLTHAIDLLMPARTLSELEFYLNHQVATKEGWRHAWQFHPSERFPTREDMAAGVEAAKSLVMEYMSTRSDALDNLSPRELMKGVLVTSLQPLVQAYQTWRDSPPPRGASPFER